MQNTSKKSDTLRKRKIYRVVLNGTRKGDGYMIGVQRRSEDSIRKQAENIYNVPCVVIPEPALTVTDASMYNAAYITGRFCFIK